MVLRIMEANIIFLRPEQSITNAIVERSDQEGNSNATVATRCRCKSEGAAIANHRQSNTSEI